MLCRPDHLLHPSASRAGSPPQGVGRGWLGALLGCGMMLLSVAHGQPAASHAPGLDSLHDGLRQWLASTQGVAPASVQIAAGDARLRVPPCEKAVVFDHPFSNKQNVRARCEQPTWQHYFQVSVGPTGGAGSATPASVTGLVPRQVLVSPQMLKRGTVLQAGMLKATEVALPSSEAQVLTPQQNIANMELVRDLPANTPLRSYDLKASLLVRRGQQVVVQVGEGRGFLISVRAEALQDGLLGEQIRLKNTESGRLLSAVVTGSNMAKGL